MIKEKEELKHSLIEAYDRMSKLEADVASLKGRIKEQSTEVLYLRDYIRELAKRIEKFVLLVGEYRAQEMCSMPSKQK